jgi:predicted  nucleic acid-binding Zn-ribbon protein
MGPTIVALVKLMRADQALREAETRYEHAAKSVRVQERRLADLNEKHKLATTNLRELQARSGNLELDVKSREEHIEKLRAAQQNAHNNKEYQALLTQINTEKIDKGKAEDEQLKVMQQVENTSAEAKALQAQIDETTQQHTTTKEQLGGKLAELQAEIDRLRPERDAAAAVVPAKARDMFERMADKYEGESLAAIARPNPRREEYVCTSCNMDLVVDLYNRLHTRDELVFCPSCKRALYIPDDLPPEMAVNKKKVVRAKKEDDADGQE